VVARNPNLDEIVRSITEEAAYTLYISLLLRAQSRELRKQSQAVRNSSRATRHSSRVRKARHKPFSRTHEPQFASMAPYEEQPMQVGMILTTLPHD
jgi:hypothetical protein